MQYKTHIIGGLVCASLVGFFFSLSYSYAVLAVGIICVIIGSLFPDIDYHKSKLGKYFFYVNYGVKHRGILHSVFGLAFVCALFYFFLQIVPNSLFYLSAFLLGMVSHLLLDMLTKKGIQPLYPFKWKIRGPFKTGKIGEFMLLVLLLIVLVILAII